MAIRLEKSGGLILIHGAPDPPEKKKWWNEKTRGFGPWVVLALFVASGVFASTLATGGTAVSEAVKGLLASVK